jgi:hypothetical protein
MTRGPIAAVALLFVVAAWPVQAGRVDKVTDANESMAVVTLQAIVKAQSNYRLTCGNGGYAASLAALAAVDGSFGSAPKLEKSGYVISVAGSAESNKGPADCKRVETVTRY